MWGRNTWTKGLFFPRLPWIITASCLFSLNVPRQRMWGWKGKEKFLQQKQKTPDCPLAMGLPSHPEEASGGELVSWRSMEYPLLSLPAVAVLLIILVCPNCPGVGGLFFLKLQQASRVCDPWKECAPNLGELRVPTCSFGILSPPICGLNHQNKFKCQNKLLPYFPENWRAQGQRAIFKYVNLMCDEWKSLFQTDRSVGST